MSYYNMPMHSPTPFVLNDVDHKQSLNISQKTQDHKCFQSWNITEIWEQEGLVASDFKGVAYQNLGLAVTLTNTDDLPIRIPHISHHVWFTNPMNPSEMSEKDRSTLVKKIAVLNSHDGNWNSVLWTNDPSKIPLTVKQAEHLNMQVRDIHDIDTPFLCLIDGLLVNKNFGLATDMWRVVAIKQEGGFYSDNDYDLYTEIDFLTRIYDSFFGFDDKLERYVGNAIIAARKDHPIVQEAYDLLYRNAMSSENRPDYVKYPCNLFAKTITGTGPGLLSLAVHKAANKHDNIDVVFPHGAIFFAPNTEFNNSFNFEGDCQPYSFQDTLQCRDLSLVLRAIGNDAYSGSWVQNSYWDKIGEQKALFEEYCF